MISSEISRGFFLLRYPMNWVPPALWLTQGPRLRPFRRLPCGDHHWRSIWGALWIALWTAVILNVLGTSETWSSLCLFERESAAQVGGFLLHIVRRIISTEGLTSRANRGRYTIP